VDPIFLNYFGPFYIEEENQLPFLVGYILQMVSGSNKSSEALFPKLNDEEKGSKILTQAGKLMSKVIEQEGSVEIEKVKRVCPSFDGLEILS